MRPELGLDLDLLVESLLLSCTVTRATAALEARDEHEGQEGISYSHTKQIFIYICWLAYTKLSSLSINVPLSVGKKMLAD